MHTPLKITTDYTLLKSMIKIDDIILFCVNNNIKSCGICDTNMYGVLEFYNKCLEKNIKPLVGLEINIDNNTLYLYAKNYLGYKNLLKIHTIKQEKKLKINDLEKYKNNILCIIPFKSKDLFDSLSFYDDLYIAYSSKEEKVNSKLITNNTVYVKDIVALNNNDISYIKYLYMIDNNINEDYLDKYYEEVSIIDYDEINEVVDKLNLVIEKHDFIPKYNTNIDEYEFLKTLVYKGLNKRLNNNITSEYQKRIDYELDIIKKIGFVNYFLIVYDYVLYAKKHNILVGPGRGSAAGSLVSYSIGITEIDPLKYDLMFERFLNIERITMPDIDIDFDALKREEVINYVKEKYGIKNVAGGITFSTLKSKLVLKEVSALLKIDNNLISKFLYYIDPKLNLDDNLKNEVVRKYLTNYDSLNKMYKIAKKIEGLKKNYSTHAAGVVISSVCLDEIIPIYKDKDVVLSGFPMDLIENIGLLKMDFLGLKNLTFMANILEKVGANVLKNIDLEDKKVFEIFNTLDVDGIFQFESVSMRSLLNNFKIDSFNDLIAAVALVRPGPKNYVDSYNKRKHGLEKINYGEKSLESILKSTYGILIYQEQIIKILGIMGSYSLAEADIIRRAISKKKESIILSHKEEFIKRSINNGYKESLAINVYDKITKFAEFGFNKSHSVAYALIAYQMAYLKTYYKDVFLLELLKEAKNIDLKENIVSLKKNNIAIIKPSVLNSNTEYVLENKRLIMPLSSINGISKEINKLITECNYLDYFDFLYKTKSFLNKDLIIILIKAGALDCFNMNRNTLINNLENGLNYAYLVNDEISLIKKPELVEFKETSSEEKRIDELNSFGFYITNHPSSLYNKDVLKLENINKFLFKKVNCYVIIDSIKKIKTKKNEDMAFLSASDETSGASFTIFPKNISDLENIKVNDFVLIKGEVSKRFDKTQIIVNSLKKV